MTTPGRIANDGRPGGAEDGRQPARSDFVQSLDRGLAVIRAFGPDRERLSLSEVARATGLTRAAARRVLLAPLGEDGLERSRAEAPLEPLTANTVTDAGRLREILREVAAQGYAIVDQELEEGLRAVAAPIRGAADVGMAAINVSAHASRVSIASLRSDILPALLETVRGIEADLQAQGGT